MKKIYILTIILCGVLSCKSNNSEQYATKRPNCKTTINNHDNSINEIYHITNKVIVVVDDVITTGATAEAVAAALKRAGAAKVYVLTAASVTDARVARVLGQERCESAVRREKQRQRLMKKLEKERIKAEKSKVD